MPGARMRWMVTMKFSPVKMELKPATKMPSAGGDHVGIQVVGAERRGEGPAGIDAAEDQRGDGEDAAGDVEVPAQQVDLGEGEIFGARP